MFGFRKNKSSEQLEEKLEGQAPAAAVPAAAEDGRSGGLFGRLRRGLSRTREVLGSDVRDLIALKREIDDEVLEELESRLLLADAGVEATRDIVDALTRRVERRQLADADALFAALREEVEAILAPAEQPFAVDASASPYVILMVGVNGVGKTTTIGKLARRLLAEGHSVLLAAGDTFRAAAVEQLQEWGDRNGVPVIAQQGGADSASVIYDAVMAARARGIDVVIADTAGRLHTKSNLMEELKKIRRVINRLDENAPHEVMLTVDAGTGQNALAQAREFDRAIGLTGITLTKLDGTARGGILISIARTMAIPVRFIGVGETAEDLRPFNAADFTKALFDPSGQESG
jgi:fused signal recognition particle receptor